LLAGLFALQLISFSESVIFIVVMALLLTFLRYWALLCCFLAGALLFAIPAHLVIDSRISKQFEGDSILTEVRVIDFPRRDGPSTSLLLEPIDDSRLPDRIRASWFEPPQQPALGEIWQMELRLRRPRGSSNPGIFDYESWLFRERVGAAGYVVPGERNRPLGSRKMSAIERIRADFVDRVNRVIDDENAAAVLVAIAVGSRHLLSAEQWQRYAQTGTSHLMAISGLHVGLASVAAYFATSGLLALLGVRRCNHDIALIAALLLAGAYVGVSGFAVPAQRAIVMLVLVATALLRRRQLHSAALVAGACMIVAIADPLATMSPGFKLSFAAVVALLWLGKRHVARGAAVKQLVHMQLVLLLGLLPFTVLIFQRVPMLAPAVNLVAVPVFSFLTVPATLVSLAAGWDWPLRIASASVEWLERLIALSAGLPVADTHTAGAGIAVGSLVLLALAWALLPPGWPGRHIAWLALIGVLLWKPGAPPFGCAEISVLDVGQGLAVVVRTNQSVVVYDTGPAYRGGGSAAERVVIPYLRAQGISRIDKVIVSHADLDHIGGLPAIRSSLHVAEVWLSGPDHGERRCRRGLRWSYDGIDFSFLHPSANANERNDGSCVLLVEAACYSVLLTGDIETVAENELVRAGLLRPVDVVTVPHHGSRTSSSTPFVERLRPGYAVVSAGFANRWGFPKQDVVERWRDQGAEVLSTAESGAVEFSLCQRGGVGRLRQQRQIRRRLWHEH
jgi:competence protein ComEC